MTISSRHDASAKRAAGRRRGESSQSDQNPDRQLFRWGGVAGLAGAILMIGAGVVVGALGLPDASDVETLADFADIKSGRIAEHALYLGALMMFALHTFVLYRLLESAHAAAALFGTVTAAFGLVIMAAGSLLHVATSPLADLYTDPGTPSEDLQSIEYAWHGAQSVFDTMLTTGILLVPIGIILFGVAMRSAPEFGSWLAWLALGLGVAGVIGAAVAIVDPGSEFAAVSVLAAVAFYLSSGWRTLALGNRESVDLAGREPTQRD